MLKARQRKIHPGLKQRRFRQHLRRYREERGTRVHRRLPRAAVPSFFTLMNLFCGFLALTQTLESHFVSAAWLIVLAGFFDLLDGMMARLTNGSSLFGVELDSLADIVSFGVAPAFLIYTFGLQAYGVLGVLVAALPAICGSVRLARFNVAFDGEKTDYFKGLPIPVQAIAVVAIILNSDTLSFLDPNATGRLSILIPTVVVLSGLMLTNIAFDATPKPSAAYMRAHPVKTVLIGLAVVLLVFFHELGLIIDLVGYLAIGMGRAVVQFVHAVMETEPDHGNHES